MPLEGEINDLSESGRRSTRWRNRTRGRQPEHAGGSHNTQEAARTRGRQPEHAAGSQNLVTPIPLIVMVSIYLEHFVIEFSFTHIA